MLHQISTINYSIEVIKNLYFNINSLIVIFSSKIVNFYKLENLKFKLRMKELISNQNIIFFMQREKEPQEEWVKPWQTIPPPPINGELKEQWPADTEDCGQVPLCL